MKERKKRSFVITGIYLKKKKESELKLWQNTYPFQPLIKLFKGKEKLQIESS